MDPKRRRGSGGGGGGGGGGETVSKVAKTDAGATSGDRSNDMKMISLNNSLPGLLTLILYSRHTVVCRTARALLQVHRQMKKASLDPRLARLIRISRLA